jgi:hypothetical protein
VPTLADVLGFKLRGWSRRAGRSAFGATVRRRTEVRMLNRAITRYITIGRDEYTTRRRANRERFAREFGHGIFGIGSNSELIGERVDELVASAASGARARFSSPGRRVRGKPNRRVVPARVTGVIRGSDGESVRDLALALNGRIVAVGRSVRLLEDSRERFSLLFPPSRLRRGMNTLHLFEVGADLSLRRLD